METHYIALVKIRWFISFGIFKDIIVNIIKYRSVISDGLCEGFKTCEKRGPYSSHDNATITQR